MAYTTINKPSDYFNTVTWSGDNTDRTISGVGFQPDWIWWKQRNGTDSHRLADSVRGEGSASYKLLFSEDTSAEFNGNDNGGSQGNINAITSDGFSGVQGTSGWNNWNGSGFNYVSWNWLAGGTASSNTDGSITSSVSANTTSGFSIVGYTGNGTGGATVGHGLGQALDMIILKRRINSAEDWYVWHNGLASTQVLYLNGSQVAQTRGDFNNTIPTSSVFSLSGGDNVNNSSSTYIAYCFAEKKGFSKFGTYTGVLSGGSTALGSPFVYTGFKPAMVILKSYSHVENWVIKDAKRDTFNYQTTALYPNLTSVEGTGYNNGGVDFYSNGFSINYGTGDIGSAGKSYIYAAFAENPLVTSGGTPATAR